ncbi:hypothetical protein Rsub_02141 [Raphidocelis subcapitata]|uniref:Uncharacterized protein n=1 Tax=Raphidocelis subcapitata TaxID=307507 RepID=A0A2V0NNU8_9CHLO|nr:hypothetical protein Rsub_02141 [Raphidocelis subcapitata]|eukprot:GBF89264.1 hypothetical protein Rsub_02141 [Raphidocelis subcapitata]
MASAQITHLEAAVAHGLQEVGRLQALNDDLRMRLMALYLAWRALGEVHAHLATCSGTGGDGGGGGNDNSSSSSTSDCRSAAALRAQLALEDCLAKAVRGSGSGSNDGGGSCPRDSAALAEEAARLVAPLLDHLPHLAPGCCILHIEGATAEEVESYSTMDLPALLAIWRGLVMKARGAIARADALDAQACPVPAARRAEAHAAIRDVGIQMKRLHHLLMLHAFPLYMRWGVAHLETGESVMGDADAPLSHLEAVARAARGTRIQVRLALSMHSSFRARLAAVHAERGAISDELAAASELTTAPGGAAELPLMADELAISLEENTRAESAMQSAHSHSVIALSTPVQLARQVCVAYPYPLSGPKYFAVLSHMLKFEPAAFAERAE